MATRQDWFSKCLKMHLATVGCQEWGNWARSVQETSRLSSIFFFAKFFPPLSCF